MTPDQLFLGSGDESTFQNDDSLPDLPLPTLENSMQLYYESLVPFLTKEELKHSKAVIDEFTADIGQKLQRHLEEKTKTSKNWMEKWWDEEVYLKLRLPVTPYNNMIGLTNSEGDSTPYALTKMSASLASTAKFFLQLRSEKIRPQTVKRGNKTFPLTMHQLKKCFNCCQIPQVDMDTLECHFKTKAEGPCPSHMVMFHRGHIFLLNPISETEESWSCHQWYKVLQKIVSETKEEGQGMGILTCDFRQTWAKNRKALMSHSENNRKILELIQTSVMAIALDPDEPPTSEDARNWTVGARSVDRWVDKSITQVNFKNGYVGGMSVHTPFEAVVSGMFHSYYHVEGDRTPQARDPSVPTPDYEELVFDIPPSLEGERERVLKMSTEMVTTLENENFCFNDFGRDGIRETGLHPDTFIQVVLHLTYYRLHQRPPSTYESATVRRFYRGRTETCRCCTKEMMAFVLAMEEGDAPLLRRCGLLQEAAKAHKAMMLRCEEGQGCDRHLFGLQLAAKEMGINPDDLLIFQDPAWKESGGGGNFLLSTSYFGDISFVGNMTPMREDGYTFFYSVQDKRILLGVGSYKTCPETCIYRFSKKFMENAHEVRDLCLKGIAKMKQTKGS
ncbi:unnamed protein product [Cyprideis torosa]|uniref:Uncharacterized protein n=1 Tax=Cyprideis torosa TaxID=163714 RepID=A0A7R8W790_9CRUS|nr:unnamed protein product [Cyprideis torosa]CAG0882142.1 unnamed protein product [Cyprideis torosa]